MKKHTTLGILVGFLAIGCGESGSEVSATSSDIESTESAIFTEGPSTLRRLKWEGEYNVRGVEHPFAAYLALGQEESAISGLMSRMDADFVEWLENRYDLSLMGTVDREKIFVRATVTNNERHLKYVLELAGVGSRATKLRRIDHIDFTATLRVYYRDRLLKEKVTNLVADRIQESSRTEGRGGDAISACHEICRCQDPGSIPACTATCLSRTGFGSIPSCVACVNETRACFAVSACLGSTAC